MGSSSRDARIDPSVKHIEFDITTDTPVHAALQHANETIALKIIAHVRAPMTENADTVIDAATCITLALRKGLVRAGHALLRNADVELA
jgi:hypothetical protein